jgi:hypothetical protein
LVATLRTRLDEAQAATFRFPRWIPAAAALLLAFLLTMPILLQTNKVVAPRLALHSPGPPRLSPNSESVDRSSSVEPLSSRISANRVPRHEIGRSKSSAAAPAVLIDHREAQALASLATAVQQTPEWGTGLLQPAALPPADLKALPAIEIADLKVAPLTEERW